MVEALVLDLFLILILLLLIPIGMYRGGLREVCASAGLLLGLMVSAEWSDRWGHWVAEKTGIDAGISWFLMAMGTTLLFAGLIGYGAAAAFSYSPGPGGRVFGGLIALLNGVLFLGVMIQLVASCFYDGSYPDLIRKGYVSRVLSHGFDWVLLAVSLCALLATLFSMIVRERETDEAVMEVRRERPAVRRPANVPALAPEPVNLEPQVASDDSQGTAQVRIREVRHWEEKTPPTVQDLKSGWTRTWPSSVTQDANKVPWQVDQPKPGQSGRPRPQPAGTSEEAVIRDWLAEDQATQRNRSPIRRPPDDE